MSGIHPWLPAASLLLFSVPPISSSASFRTLSLGYFLLPVGQLPFFLFLCYSNGNCSRIYCVTWPRSICLRLSCPWKKKTIQTRHLLMLIQYLEAWPIRLNGFFHSHQWNCSTFKTEHKIKVFIHNSPSVHRLALLKFFLEKLSSVGEIPD